MEKETSSTKKSIEIDVIGLLQKILHEKKILAVFLLGFALLGVIVALSKPREYTATVVMAPEISSGIGMSESLSDLASMVGVNIGGGGASMDAIYPDIYPDIFASNDFIIQLFEAKVPLSDDKGVKSYSDHINNDFKTPFWTLPKKWLFKLFEKRDKKDGEKANQLNPFQLTRKQYNTCNSIRSSIGCGIDKKTNVITISVVDQDPLVAATIADTLQSMLQKYITAYRTQKARNDLEYAQRLAAESKAQYVKAQQLYASFADANTDVVLRSVQAKQEQLENDMQLKYNTYTQMAQQLQMAKAKLQERTPAFTVIQAASVPLKPSSFPKAYVVFLFILLGFAADALWILYIRDYLKSKKQ